MSELSNKRISQEVFMKNIISPVKENSLALEVEAALNILWPHLALKLCLSVDNKHQGLIQKKIIRKSGEKNLCNIN